MKRLLSLLLVITISFGYLTAQNNDDQIKMIKNQLKKTEEKLKDPKNENNYKLWAKLGKLYLDAYEVNVKYLVPGMQSNLIPLLGVGEDGNTEPYYGKPKSTEKTQDGAELWKYDKVTLIIRNGQLEGWEVTESAVEDPLLKSYNAYMKAIEKDPKGKYVHKSSTKKQLAKLRDYLRSEAISYYKVGDYKKALNYWELAMKLYDMPRNVDDTVNMPAGGMDYYAGIFAYMAKDYPTAEKYFKKAIEKEYEVGNAYSYLSDVYMKEGKEKEAVKLLEQGAEKYPTESKIIFRLIDYYKPHGEYEKAFVYIDKAIELNPDMAILYLVKGDAYNTIYKDFEQKYDKALAQSDSLKKAAFRARYEKAKHDKILAEKEKVDKQVAEYGENMNKYFTLAETWFKKGIEKDPKNSDSYYTLGALYYNRAMAVFKRAQRLPTSDVSDYNKLIKEYEGYLKKALEQFEKANELKPNDVQTLNNMAIINYKLRNYDKYKELKQKIEEIKAQQNQAQTQQN